jgi:hypothetical protein
MKYFVFVWSGTISVLVYLLVEQLAQNYLDAVGYVPPEPINEEFDPTYSSEAYSYDYENPNNVGHGLALDDD